MYRIVAKERLNQDVVLMTIEAPFVARRCEPGQFIIVRVEEGGERVPLTIMDFDRKSSTVTIVFQTVGYSTRLLDQKEAGDTICDFVGPLGQPSHLKAHKRVLGIAGGVGAAPLYPQLRKLKEMGVSVDLIIGARTNDLVILKDRFEAICDRIDYATNDGTIGVKGFVTDVLKDKLSAGEVYDEIIAIGPLIMMKAVVDITKPLGIKTAVSLNPVMIDGTGMCGGCRVTIGNETKFACVDGPDFDGHLVDFDTAMNRQNFYKDQEAHICNIGGDSIG